MKAVADASLLIRTCIKDQYTGEARKWLATVDDLLAPQLLWYEVTSALRRLEYAGFIDRVVMDQSLQALFDLQIRLCGSRVLYRRMIDLARELNTSCTYDMAYLALALEEDCPLVTMDERLIGNARARGYTVLHPIEALIQT